MYLAPFGISQTNELPQKLQIDPLNDGEACRFQSEEFPCQSTEKNTTKTASQSHQARTGEGLSR